MEDSATDNISHNAQHHSTSTASAEQPQHNTYDTPSRNWHFKSTPFSRFIPYTSGMKISGTKNKRGLNVDDEFAKAATIIIDKEKLKRNTS